VLETLLSGTGFALAVGLNATLPLLILALADRSASDNIDHPLDAISSNAGIVVLLFLLPIELIADKIPKIDHFSNLAHTLFRPVAGALAFAAIASLDGDLNPWIAGILGFAIALGVHLWKIGKRPTLAAASRGIGTPIISILEDALVIVLCVSSAFVPIANIVLIPLAGFLILRTTRRLETGESRTIQMLGGRARR
jgi:hypothetical protein